MTYDETLKIFAVLKANYNNFFKSITRADAEGQVGLWADMFQDEPYSLVSTAVKCYIATDVSGYPPNVGIIKEQIRKLTQKDDMTEQEAINLIMKALSNSIYDSEKEFNKLPPVLQSLVGSPNTLREWAVMDSDTVNSVVASNVMRSYRVAVEKQRQRDALPAEIRNLLSNTVNKMSIEGNSKMLISD